MANAMELLKSAATTGASGNRNPLDIFYGKLDTQIEYAKQVKDGKTLNSRSLWFRKDGAGYVVRIGRNGFELAGSKLFKAADLDAVQEVLKAAKDVIQSDKKVQDMIALHSMERSTRLKAGRANKKKK
jgi:hypothetical protein